MNYQIITNEDRLDEFVSILPENTDQEVYYLCLFGRHKYCPEFPPAKNAGQLARLIATKKEIKTKIRRLECPVGSYVRDDVVAPQECISVYITPNPRSLVKANKEMLIEMAKRCADGKLDFNPISLANTSVHRATDRKVFVDFDFDTPDPTMHLSKIKEILPDPDSYHVLITRGGFHLLVRLEAVRGNKKWYPSLAELPGCDVRGSDTLIPVAGCYQGGFTPFLDKTK